MNTRFAIPLLCAAAIAFACGPLARSSASARTPAPHKSATSKKKAPVTQPLASSLAVRVGPTVAFELRVANATDKEVELTFPSGQTHDITVVDASGAVVWQWSADRFFTQSLQNRSISPRDTTTFDGEWTPPAGVHGPLTAVATMTDEGRQAEARASFVLP